MYAIIFYGYFEKTDIPKKYSYILQLYKRAIVDICGIWRENLNNPNVFDFTYISKLKFRRLCDRDHKQEGLELLFEEAIRQLDSLDQSSGKETISYTLRKMEGYP